MFYLSRAALPRMREGATIINTASVQAYNPSPTLLAYATTKGAIVTFTKALSQLALKQGIRVNAVAPGPVWTPLIPSTMPVEHVEKFGKSNPQGRPAQPAELAPTYVFLASDESRYINGAIFDLTGGKMLP
jgi:NAD(P)-dependent dehydrogenase (short-subunit alcohol dehydrogenase family)